MVLNMHNQSQHDHTSKTSLWEHIAGILSLLSMAPFSVSRHSTIQMGTRKQDERAYTMHTAHGGDPCYDSFPRWNSQWTSGQTYTTMMSGDDKGCVVMMQVAMARLSFSSSERVGRWWVPLEIYTNGLLSLHIVLQQVSRPPELGIW